MHVSDIRLAIDKGATSEIEDAFGALVLYPGYLPLEGSNSAAGMADLLNDVASALDRDTRLMDGALADFIRDETDGDLNATTFAAGSRAVLRHMPRWRGFFNARFTLGGRTSG